ncbi:MAG TPA: type VI secretion system membrane subunit TssM, partial [Nitrospiria bacterium]|nr:type VI secretion system membrane subunit TssM [Nitrospiria bacterium]
QGVGGTRNCDWWFTSEAVLLDTAGRYVTEDDDRDEWFGFLDLLRKYRRGKPINGILAAISLPDLLQGSDEDMEYHAKNIRARIDELIQRLGIVFPVYLVFTKCDLIQGFVEFFEDLNKGEREQIWGCTLPKNPAADQLPKKVFDSEFGNLLNALYARRIVRFTSARGSQKIRDIYGFPLQMASGREKLAQFVEVLFQPNPYHENPIFRGFYFTSGTQEGTPIDRILSAVSRASGLSEAVSSSFEVQKESKSYFIKNLFTDVIFQDQILAEPSSAMARQRGYLRVAVFAGAVILTALILTGSTFSFIGNRYLLGVVKSASLKAVQMDIKDDRQFDKNIELLDRLRGGLERLKTYREEGLPSRLRGGLYRGSTLYPPMRDLYFQRFKGLMLAPTQATLETALQRFVSNPQSLPEGRDYDYYYALLKTYLMMSDPSHLDPPYLDRQLRKLWEELLRVEYGEGRIPPGLSANVAQQVGFYSTFRDPEGVPRLRVDQALVKEVRRVLKQVPVAERFYGRARREALESASDKSSGPLEPYVLRANLSNVFSDDYKIPGVFTVEGWKGPFKNAMDRVMKDTDEEAWVLGETEPPRGDLDAAVEKLYFDEYIRHWRTFLESARLKSAEGLADTEKLFAALDQDDSPMAQLLSDVARNTDLSGGKRFTGVSMSMIEKVRKGIGLGSSGEGESASGGPDPVTARFDSLHDFVTSSDPKKEAPLGQYIGELRRAHEAIRAMLQSGQGRDAQTLAQNIATGGTNDIALAQKNADRILQDLDPEMRRVLSPLLLQPFRAASSGVMSAALSELNRRWKSDVYDVWQQSIAGRYPFRAGGEEASMTDVAEFFQPENGALWKFYDKEIKPFVDEGRNRWEVKREMGAAMPLSADFLEFLRQARMISEGLFPRGSAELKLSFDLYPYPSPGVSESVIQIDGKGLRYRNEPQEWHEFIWPGPSGTPGAVVQAHFGNMLPSEQFSGRWGFFKLLDSAKITPLSNTVYKVEFDLKGQTPRPLKIRYDLRAQSYKNPFKPGMLSDFHCPAKVG